MSPHISSLDPSGPSDPTIPQTRLRVCLTIGSEVIAVGVRRLLEHSARIELVGELTVDCDLILVDGLAARGPVGSRIRRLRPTPSVVGLRPQGITTDPDVARYLHPGRWIPMSVTAEDLIGELEAAHHEHRAARDDRPPIQQEESDVSLTKREQEILGFICGGHTNQEIAAALFLSVNSVKSHIRTLYQKIGTTRRSQAVVWGWARGF